ncbi:hypothetical protein [Microbacterium elymi]|uniref:hypothetical protein n=1 Tax=Microbacterium elymi TaxID=2909587 RepID=UPI00338F2C9D
MVERLKDGGDEMLAWLDGDDLRNSLVDDEVLPALDPDVLAGPFAHVVVDEAQELSDAQWQMRCAAARRAPSRSSATGRRHATASPSRGRHDWSGSVCAVCGRCR